MYGKIKENLDWGSDETPNLANRLAEFFVKNERKGNPYSLSKFEEDLKNEQVIKDCMTKLQSWVTSEKATNAYNSLKNFENTFKEKINKLSSTWDE